MKAIIFIAHGSKKKDSNNEFIELIKSISKEDKIHDLKEAAFLEIATPNLRDVINKIIKKGAKKIELYPFFLNSGKHVAIDIPNIKNEYEEKFPSIRFKLYEHFGKSKSIETIILNDINSN